MKKELETYSIVINPEDDIGIAISFVNIPASYTNWATFSASKKSSSFPILNDEQRIITSVAFRANYKMLRRKNGKEFYVTLDPDSIRNLSISMLSSGALNNVNLNHNDFDRPRGIQLCESFIITDKHKLLHDNFKELETGSWMLSYRINNDKVWNAIKEGKFNGISPEIIDTLEFHDNDRLISSIF